MTSLKADRTSVDRAGNKTLKALPQIDHNKQREKLNSILGNASDELGVENPINKIKPPRASSNKIESNTRKASQ